MKTTHFKNKFKILGIASILGLSLSCIPSVSAWGPEDRPTFTMGQPATYPTFNSITDNPTIGDERDFVRVGEIDAEVTDLKNEVEVVPGRQYLVYVYFHNNASSTFNNSAHDYSGIAIRARMANSFSTVLTPENKGTITSVITADNANPADVWDEAYMTTTTKKVLMHYVPGSAKIYNDWKTNGSIMPTNLFTQEGALLGLNALNGLIPGCEEYHGVVTYVLQAEELGGTIDKTVSIDGNNYGESINVKPGDEVHFKLAIVNTGDIELTNAVVRDNLPEGLKLVPGSVELYANDSTTPDILSDDISGAGYNLGTIGTGNMVYITYRATVEGDYDCEGTELLNNAELIYDSDTDEGDRSQDAASVNVTKEDCTEPEIPPLDNCETNPGMEGCQVEETCLTNPEMEGCQELPNTGPLEIIMAIVVVLGIAGGGYYLYRTQKTLKTVEGDVVGKTTPSKENKDTKSENQKNRKDQKQ